VQTVVFFMMSLYYEETRDVNSECFVANTRDKVLRRTEHNELKSKQTVQGSITDLGVEAIGL
jgi:hypothetical protein